MQGSAFAIHVYCDLVTVVLPVMVLVLAGIVGGPLLVVPVLLVGLPLLLWRVRGTHARVDGNTVIVRNVFSTHVLEGPVRMCDATNRFNTRLGSSRALKNSTGRCVVVHAALRLTDSGSDAAEAWLLGVTRRSRR